MMATRWPRRWNEVETLTDQRPEYGLCRSRISWPWRGRMLKVFISGAKRGVTRTIAKLLRRRSAIEPMIGHMKNDGRLRRSTLKGTQGDALFAVLCGCGHNIRMILRHLSRLFCTDLIRLIRQICMIIHAEMALCQRDHRRQNGGRTEMFRTGLSMPLTTST